MIQVRIKILYVDPNKNRTDMWLSQNRLQLPLGINQYGPISNVTFKDDIVNSQYMQDGNNNTQNGKTKMQIKALGDAVQKNNEIVNTNKNNFYASHSIVTLPDGNKYVSADRQVIYSNNPDKWSKELEQYINEKIRNGKDLLIPTDDGDVIKITKDTAWKVSDNNNLDDNGFGIKMNAGAHIDELAKISK